jgi:hypothetical protein
MPHRDRVVVSMAAFMERHPRGHAPLVPSGDDPRATIARAREETWNG